MHCVGNLDWTANLQLFRFMLELFEGATIIFIMVSGYLFQHLSDRFDYSLYLSKKFKNVIAPYIAVSLPGILLLLTKPYFLTANPELQGSPWWERVGFLYIYGGSQLNYVLWFIPVMTIFYLLAPIFIIFLRKPAFFLSLVILIPASILAHRTSVQKYHHIHLAFYFLSAYMSGMVAGLYRENVWQFLERYILAIGAIYISVLLGHFLFTDYIGSYVSEVFSRENGLIDWLYIQKFTLFFILIYIFRRLDGVEMRSLDFLATISFAIFFLHIYVLHVYSHLVHWHQFPGNILNTLWLFLLAIGCSSLIAVVLRRALGPSSRVLIGA